MSKIRGYKVFNPDWTCRGFKYEVGKTYEESFAPSVCNRGFHFCKKAADCFGYYGFDPNNKVAEIIAHGEVAEDGDKCATNKIEIVREIPWAELLDLVNTGKANSGDLNSGNLNSGDWNSGDLNSGNLNSGNRNSGDLNSGNLNSGDWNSGDWNSTSHSSGCFNTEKHDLLFFDKPTNITFMQWRSSAACGIMNRIDFLPTEWIQERQMTDEEKAAHPESGVTGGYLKIRDNSNCFRAWWNGLTSEEKEIVKGIPNFDPEKFKEITGIDVKEAP